MGPDHFGWGGWGMFPMIMPITMLIVALIIIYLLVGRGESQSRDSESAIEILKKRYARGEITKEEFEQIRKDLEN